MARRFATNFKDPPLLSARQEKWIRGVNQIVSATQIRPDELAEGQDIQLVEDGKIQCPRDGQAYFGNSQGSHVRGLFAFYKSNGTRQLLRMSGTTLQKYNSSTLDWDNVSGYAYTSDLNTNGVMTYDRLYLGNGTDPLTYYDGTSITSFTAISVPAAPTVTRTGSAGTYTFSYKVTAVTAVGETTGSAAGSTTLDRATLDASNYMTVTWAAVTSAIGYNVYGRKATGWFFLSYVEGNTTTTYVDKNTDTPNEVFPPPEGNSTAGPVGKYIAVYKDSLFILGDPVNPSRLYYSGGGDKINDFTVGGGGGFIDVSKNDGQSGTGLIVFKNSLVVFKEDSIYQFSFTTTGLPQVSQVNPALGAVAPRSIIAVENDIFFASRRGIFTLGNEAGFSFDVLRSNELSSRVRPIYQASNPAYIQNIAAHYTTDANKNLVVFSYTPSGSTTNSKALVYDRERLGWYKWNNIAANCWVTYRGTDSLSHYLYGDDASGYVKEILSGTSDFGTAINGYFYLNGQSFKTIDRYKILKDVDIVLRKPSGAINLSIVQDGVETVFQTNIGTVSPSINFGHYLIARFLFKTSYGVGVSSQDELVLRTLKNLNLEGKTFQLRFNNNSASTFVLLSAGITARARSERFRHSDDVVST